MPKTNKLACGSQRAPSNAKAAGFAEFLARASETTLDNTRLRRFGDAANAWRAACEQLSIMLEALSDAKAADLILQSRTIRQNINDERLEHVVALSNRLKSLELDVKRTEAQVRSEVLGDSKDTGTRKRGRA